MRLTLTLCVVEICGLLGIAAFPALLPLFKDMWQLSYTQAGWITAVYYFGYIVTVPLLVCATDVVDARRVVICGSLIGAGAALGFALLADGFWSALVLRLIGGISLAGIYMPGLKLVSDFTEGPSQSRFVSFYTASFAIGTSLSYLAAGEIATRLNWRWAFGLAGASAAVSILIVWLAVPSSFPAAKRRFDSRLLDFRPVFRTPAAMGYTLAYAAHMWENFGMRSWIVAFLTFSLAFQNDGGLTLQATQIAFAVNLIGLPASIGGNELARRFGRSKTIGVVMISSALLCLAIGLSSPWPILAVGLSLLHGVTVVGDSAAITAGAVAAAPQGLRGTTLALHSTLGFAAAFLGPLAVGLVLDLFGANLQLAWAMAYLTMAVGAAAGPLVLHFYGQRSA